MAQPETPEPPPTPSPQDQQAPGPEAMLGAMFKAASSNCDCEPCRILRLMGEHLTDQLLSSMPRAGVVT